MAGDFVPLSSLEGRGGSVREFILSFLDEMDVVGEVGRGFC